MHFYKSYKAYKKINSMRDTGVYIYSYILLLSNSTFKNLLGGSRTIRECEWIIMYKNIVNRNIFFPYRKNRKQCI